jgi:hypothetical protein
MRMYDKAGRSRWPYIIGAAVVIVAIAGVIVNTTTRTPNASTSSRPTPSASASVPAPGGTSGAGDGENDVAPTGCLGGLDRNAAMVLAAQKAAKHSTYGAVEAAAAFYRFVWQSPIPAGEDVAKVTDMVMASDSPASFKDLAGIYKTSPNVSNGYVADGVSFHLSTTNGLWIVSEDSTVDAITVDIAAGYVIDGELSSTKSTSMGFIMKWESNAWHVEREVRPDSKRLSAGGTRFSGGC